MCMFWEKQGQVSKIKYFIQKCMQPSLQFKIIQYMVVTSFYKKLDWQHFLAFNNLPATNEEELANCTNLNSLSMSIKI